MNNIVINKERCIKPLQAVCGIVEKKHTLAILANTLIQVKQSNDSHIQEMIFVATDLELQLSYAILLDVETTPTKMQTNELAHFTVNAHKLYAMVNSLNQGALTLSLKNNKVTLQQQKSRFELSTLDANDFPQMLIQPPTHTFEISQKTFKHQLSAIAFAMGVQDVRYYLNACLLHVEQQTLFLVATDGHRMACSKALHAIPNAMHDVDVIIPRKTVQELLKLLDDADHSMTLEINSNTITIKHPNFTLSSKLIDGKFPDFKRLLATHPHVLGVERLDLMCALQRANIVSQDKLRAVKWILRSTGLEVYASNQDQDEISEDVPSTFNGDAFDLSFNIGYWLDVLKMIKASQLNIQLNGANASAIMRTQDDVHEYTYVVMPMRV